MSTANPLQNYETRGELQGCPPVPAVKPKKRQPNYRRIERAELERDLAQEQVKHQRRVIHGLTTAVVVMVASFMVLTMVIYQEAAAMGVTP